MKRRITLCMVVMLTMFVARLSAVEVDSLDYTLNSGDNTASVTACLYQGTKEITVPQTIISGGTTYTVTSIGNNAFLDKTWITKVNLPSSLKSMGFRAFDGCTAMTEITIPAGFESFDDACFQNCKNLQTVTFLGTTLNTLGSFTFNQCQNLTSIVIPEGPTMVSMSTFDCCYKLTDVTLPSTVTSIGRRAFCYDRALTNLNIPDGVTIIDESAFYQCTKLTGITLPSALLTLGEGAFANCQGLTSIDLPSGLQKISNLAFSQCYNIEGAITVPSTVTEVGAYAFQSCQKITSVTFPDGLTTLGNGVLNNCIALESVKLPANLTSIPESMFQGCSKLTTAPLSNKIQSIGDYAFSYCQQLGDVTFPASLKTIGTNAFSGCSNVTKFTNNSTQISSIGNYAFSYCTSITSFDIPATIAAIPEGLLNGCTSLKNLTIPSTITSLDAMYCFADCGLDEIVVPSQVTVIGSCAYLRCKNAKTLTLPSGLKTIGSDAFTECTGLRSVIVPNSVDSLGDMAFRDCSSLKTAVLPKDLKTMGYEMFDGCTKLVSVTLPENLTALPIQTFSNCKALRTVELPATLTKIGNGAFYECDSLVAIYIPDGVTEIGSDAFYSSGVQYVRLPNTLKKMGRAFYSCENLEFLNVPASVESITGSGLDFGYGFKVNSVGMMGTTPPALGTDGWSNKILGSYLSTYDTPFSLLVPESAVDDYTNATQWQSPCISEVKGYPAAKQNLTADLIHFKQENKDTYYSGGPQPVVVEWFEGMGNYRVYYTDSKGNKTTTQPIEGGDYKISLAFEEGPYYKAATFNNIYTHTVQGFADEDFALLYDFYSKTKDPNNRYSWNLEQYVIADEKDWALVEGDKTSLLDATGLTWKNGHVTDVVITKLRNINANDMPASIFALPQVKSIKINGASLKGDIGKAVEEYLAAGNTLSPTLETLDLSNNQLEGNIATLANALPALKSLNVNSNKFASLYPALAETVETVDLSNQTITSTFDIDLRTMADAGLYSMIPSISLYDVANHSFKEKLTLDLGYNGLYLNYLEGNAPFVAGHGLWHTAPNTEFNCYFADDGDGNSSTRFKARLLYDMGDVDFDGVADIVDLQRNIFYLFNNSYYFDDQTEYSDQYKDIFNVTERNVFNFSAADMNSDNKINVLDIVPHVDILLANEQPKQAGARPNAPRKDIETEASLFVSGGKLRLVANSEVAALDIILNDVSANSIAIANIPGMTCSMRQQSDGRTHLVIYSLSGASLPVGETVLGSVANGATVSTAQLASPNGRRIGVRLNDSSIITGIENIENGTINIDESDAIYNLSGQKVGKDYKGIVIRNGKKVIIK